MDCMPESTVCSSRHPDHESMTGKHKRTFSPFGMVETASSSSDSGGRVGDDKGHGDAGGCMLRYYTNGQSSEGEEDMANCLIMLAQSVSLVKEDKQNLCYQKTETSNNPRLAEMADTTAGGKSDFHNYECKTCNRAFPSFQALGGHRASHKKPKFGVEDRNSASIKSEFSKEDQQQLLLEYEENKIITIHNKPPPTLSDSIQTGYKYCDRKDHECSICGSKFSSGQALGGHMRRHRPAPPSSNQVAGSTNTDDRNHHHNITQKAPVLSLDLNLPAPEVVDDVHFNFQFTGSSSQQSLVFSPALVVCHH